MASIPVRVARDAADLTRQDARGPRDPLRMSAAPDTLDEAFDRLEDFLSVWAGGITVEAAQRLLESVGIEEPERRRFAARLAEVEPRAAPGAVLLGLLIGLSAAQLAGER
jgi:hypothetical protein